jgi:2,5-diketo-D-gluconate reductase A
VTLRRIQQNFDLFDFELTEGDIGEINALNRDERTGFDPDRFNG